MTSTPLTTRLVTSPSISASCMTTPMRRALLRSHSRNSAPDRSSSTKRVMPCTLGPGADIPSTRRCQDGGMRFLSVQSSVAYGHVGNSAATFPLQRLGHEVWPVLTVVFSNHTGYGAWRGPLLSPDDVRAVVTGIEDRGVLPTCDGVLSGYLGGPGI